MTNVVYANGHTKIKLELKQSNQCKWKAEGYLGFFVLTYLSNIISGQTFLFSKCENFSKIGIDRIIKIR